jgi:hypothetical protein
MKNSKNILFGAFIALHIWIAWVVMRGTVVWFVPDPVSYEVDVTFFDWMMSALPSAGLLFAFSAVFAGVLGGIYRWLFRRKWLWRILLFPVPLVLFLLALWGSMTQFINYHEQKFYTYSGPPAEDSLGEDLMRKIAGMRELVAKAPHPENPESVGLIHEKHLAGEVFDVRDYFTVLTNLSEKSGFVLDYAHVGDWNGFPVLYARQENQAPYPTAQEFSESLLPEQWRTAEDCLQDWSPAIDLQPSEEAFLELAALHLVGNQFALYWHAGYNDRQIIATAEKLEEIINSQDLVFGNRLPVGYRIKARELDVRPVIEFVEEDAVWVELLTFSKWGGFILEKMAFSTKYPHKLWVRESETLIGYDCGLCF